jgi:photosystem II stability/assembly factor-like uncharacterized protein
MRALLVMLAIAACGSPKAALTDAGDDDGPGTDGGEPDAPPDTCPVGDWCVETSPVAATLLKSVWAAGLNTVFAVGDNGTILRRRDNAWTAMESPTTEHLRGVWAASPTDAWAVGEGGTILRYDGTAWTATGSSTLDFKAIWGSGSDDVWMAGFGSIVHWNGSAFDSKTLTGELLSISGTGPDDVWVTGESAKVDHFTGTWTTGIDAGGGNSYFAILALPATEVWVSTFAPNMQTRQFDGVSTWTPHSTSGAIFVGFYAAAPDDIWGVGTTTAARWNGSAWTGESPAGNMADLQSVSGIGSSLWIVGSDSLILHRRD